MALERNVAIAEAVSGIVSERIVSENQQPQLRWCPGWRSRSVRGQRAHRRADREHFSSTSGSLNIVSSARRLTGKRDSLTQQRPGICDGCHIGLWIFRMNDTSNQKTCDPALRAWYAAPVAILFVPAGYCLRHGRDDQAMPTRPCAWMGNFVRVSTRVPYFPKVFSTTQKSKPGITTSCQRSPMPRRATSSIVTI